MKELTILDEGYIELQKAYADSYKDCDIKLTERAENIIKIKKEYFKSLQESDAIYSKINFRNDKLIRKYLKDGILEENAVLSIRELKNRKNFTLTEATILSYIKSKFNKAPKLLDEFEEATYFFGSENCKIVNENSNYFLTVNENGIKQAILEFGKIPTIAYENRKLFKESNVIETGIHELDLLDEMTTLLLK